MLSYHEELKRFECEPDTVADDKQQDNGQKD